MQRFIAKRIWFGSWIRLMEGRTHLSMRVCVP